MEKHEGVQPIAPVAITVVFSPSSRHVAEHALHLEAGTTIKGALAMLDQLPGFESLKTCNTDRLMIGIWGQKTDTDQRLENGDRLEIYRPLVVDPKVARRLRFKGQGAKNKSAGLFAKRRDGAKAGY